MKEEILSLNLLRFLACLSVICGHFFATLVSAGYLPYFLTVFSPFTQYGYLGVNAFFLISGFVISLSAEGRTAREFLYARFIRLYPLFWVCVAITTFLAVVFDFRNISLGQFLANLTMLPGVFGNYEYIDGVYWTLAVELRFYLFIGLLVALRSYFNVNLQKAALVVTVLAICNIILRGVDSTSVPSHIFSLFLDDYWSGYVGYFIAGVLFYGIYENKKTYFHYPALLVCYVLALAEALHRSYPTNDKIIVVLYITSFFVMLMLISLKKISNLHFTFLGSNYKKIIILLGAVTYPLYLLHSSLISSLLELFSYFKVPTFIAAPSFFIVFALVILLVNIIDIYMRGSLKKKLSL